MLRNVSRCKSINVLDDGTTNMCGNGIGNPDEVFTLVNVHFHRRTGPVRHGDVVSLLPLKSGTTHVVWYVLCLFLQNNVKVTQSHVALTDRVLLYSTRARQW